jgi:hypothetical protein
LTKITTEQRFEYENKFRRNIVHTLTPLETKVMIYIIDRTLGWMKDRERVSYREFEYSKPGTKSDGVNVQKNSAVRAVGSLVKKGVIEVLSTSPRFGTNIRVRLEWVYQDYLDSIDE